MIFFCQVKVGQFNVKLNPNQFSFLNFYSVSSGSKGIVDFVFELAWTEILAGQYFIKGIKKGWNTKNESVDYSCLSEWGYGSLCPRRPQ